MNATTRQIWTMPDMKITRRAASTSDRIRTSDRRCGKGSDVAKDWREKFYESKAWEVCRDAFAKNHSGICERCFAEGRYRAGEIVRHKIELTPETARDVDIAMDWNNLELVCAECYEETAWKRTGKKAIRSKSAGMTASLMTGMKIRSTGGSVR